MTNDEEEQFLTEKSILQAKLGAANHRIYQLSVEKNDLLKLNERLSGCGDRVIMLFNRKDGPYLSPQDEAEFEEIVFEFLDLSKKWKMVPNE